MTFQGFPNKKVHLTPIPEPFFSDLLAQIEHLGELKLCLYIFWLLDRMTGDYRFVRRSDFDRDPVFLQGLGTHPPAAQEILDQALALAIQHRFILPAELSDGEQSETIYFLNSPKGRMAIEAIQDGRWRPIEGLSAATVLRPEPANIFKLYEEHIGPLTPLIAETLGEAQDSYPPSWIEEAFRIAVERNARNWRYIEAILKRWQEEGRNAQEDGRDSEKTRRKYIEGEYSDYIKH